MGIVSEPKSIAENWYRVQKKQKKTKQGLTDRWLWQTGDVRPVLAGLQRQNGIVRWHRRVLLARGATGQFRHPQLPSAQIRNGTVLLISSSERLNKTTELYPSELGIKIRIDATKWLAIEEIPNAIRWINVARLEEVRLLGADVRWMIASSNMFLIRDREREKKRADGSSDGDMATGQTSHRWSNCLGDDVDDEIERRRRSSRSVHSPPSNDYSPGRRLGRLIDGRTLKKSFLSRSVSFASSVISNIPVACGGGGQNDASIGLASTENKKKYGPIRKPKRTHAHKQRHRKMGENQKWTTTQNEAWLLAKEAARLGKTAIGSSSSSSAAVARRRPSHSCP